MDGFQFSPLLGSELGDVGVPFRELSRPGIDVELFRLEGLELSDRGDAVLGPDAALLFLGGLLGISGLGSAWLGSCLGISNSGNRASISRCKRSLAPF